MSPAVLVLTASLTLTGPHSPHSGSSASPEPAAPQMATSLATADPLSMREADHAVADADAAGKRAGTATDRLAMDLPGDELAQAPDAGRRTAQRHKVFKVATTPPDANRPLTSPTIEGCIVSIKDEVMVPARDDGVLATLNVEQGDHVGVEEVMGQIDDREMQLRKQLAEIELAIAAEAADNDVNVRFAEAATHVAQAEHEQAIEANSKVSGTFPRSEVRRLKFEWDRADLQIEQATMEQDQAKQTKRQRSVEVQVADHTIDRRVVQAPLEGEVVTVMKHEGEWVRAGDPIFRIMRFDVMRIEGFLNAGQYDPHEVAGREVTVKVSLARGRVAEVKGQVSYVSPVVQAGGEYRIWADVENRKEHGFWVLRPGLDATMTVHLDQPAMLTQK